MQCDVIYRKILCAIRHNHSKNMGGGANLGAHAG